MSDQNGTGQQSAADQEAQLIVLHGLCRRRSRLAKRNLCHDWHPAGPPALTPVSAVYTRVCCYCAPEGVTILVRTTISGAQIQAEMARHGPRLFFEQVIPGLTLPGDPGYSQPPGV